MSFHRFDDSSLPQSKTYLLSASTDGLISIIDPSVAEEEDAVIVVFNNKAAISHVVPYRNVAGVRMLCVVSQDEKLTVFEVGDLAEAKREQEVDAMVVEDEEVKQWPAEDLRERLGCDYVVAMRPHGTGGGLALVVGTYRESVPCH